ncbi:MAG: hypothetical protein RBT11_19120 [Desulfobacterales bacterium]|jgi:hypothetical protein|nr:hypothetical protein [Desulfobacterales bacterium]MDY0242578.1 hypothetical protein [Rhodospirillaceae bacterium]
MAYEQKVLDVSFPAAESLVNDQYRFVVLASTGVRRPDTAAEVSIGILQNAPAAGEAAVVRIFGVSKMVANAALGVGAFVKHEYVDAADAGKGEVNTAAPTYTRAMVVGAAGAENDLATVLLTSPFPAINDAVQGITAVATINTAGVATYTAANLVGGLILRDPAGAGREDVTPTAAQIVAAVAGAIVTSSFEFTIRNTADGDETITVTAGAGITLSGTMTIAQNNSKRFLAVVTNATAEAEAVTIYSLGTVVH